MNRNEAYNAIQSRFKTFWDTKGFKAIYENTKPSDNVNQDTDSTYAEVILRNASSQNISFSNSEGQINTENAGIVRISIYEPLGKGLTGHNSEDIPNQVKNLYVNYSYKSLWFRNASIEEKGREGSFFRTDVTATFLFDEQV